MNKRKYIMLGFIIVLLIGTTLGASFILSGRSAVLRQPIPAPPAGATIMALPNSTSGVATTPNERGIAGWEAEALSTIRRLGFASYQISILGFPANTTLDQVSDYYVAEMNKMGYRESVLTFKNPEGHWVTSWRDNDAGTGFVVIFIPSLGDSPTYAYAISGQGAQGKQVLPTPDD